LLLDEEEKAKEPKKKKKVDDLEEVSGKEGSPVMNSTYCS
jgi:hypothetical protein